MNLRFLRVTLRYNLFNLLILFQDISFQKNSISVIIPAFNEEKSITKVIDEIPAGLINEIVVVNNGSDDETALKACQAGVTVLNEPQKGYGRACLKGIEYLKKMDAPPEIVVFLDADYSDNPSEMNRLVKPIIENDVDMVIGSRALGKCEKGAMLPQQIFGNRLAVWLLKVLYDVRFTDLGPFRAIKLEKLLALNMEDKNFGWTIEMQVKAAKNGLSFTEIPVSYKQRIGVSKVTGTLRGTVMAGYKILFTLFKLRNPY